MAYSGISFLDYSIVADYRMLDLDRQIHSTPFPNMQFIWQD